MHSGVDTMTFEACDLHAVITGVDFQVRGYYSVESGRCDLDPVSIDFWVEGGDHTVGDGFLTIEDDSFLVFQPVPPDTFEDGDTISVCLLQASDMCGGRLFDPVCWEFYVDLTTPKLLFEFPLPESEIIGDTTPSVRFYVYDSLSGLASHDDIVVVLQDTLEFPLSGPGFSFDGDTARFSSEEAGVSWHPGDTVEICLRVPDNPDYCPPNVLDTCWSFILMYISHTLSILDTSAHSGDTVDVSVVIDSVQYPVITRIRATFRFDPARLVPLGVALDPTYLSGWTVDEVDTDYSAASLTVDMHGSSAIPDGALGRLFWIRSVVPESARGGDFCAMRFDSLTFNGGGYPIAERQNGFFLVLWTTDDWLMPIILNDKTYSRENLDLAIGGVSFGTSGYQPGLDLVLVPSPATVRAYITIDDPDYSYITMLKRSVSISKMSSSPSTACLPRRIQSSSRLRTFGGDLNSTSSSARINRK